MPRQDKAVFLILEYIFIFYVHDKNIMGSTEM